MKKNFTVPTVELMSFLCAGETDNVNTGKGDPSVQGDSLDDLLNQ